MTNWTKNLTKLLDFYSQFTPTPLSIKHFLEFGKLIFINVFNFYYDRIEQIYNLKDM
mgnify:FL=1